MCRLVHSWLRRGGNRNHELVAARGNSIACRLLGEFMSMPGPCILSLEPRCLWNPNVSSTVDWWTLALNKSGGYTTPTPRRAAPLFIPRPRAAARLMAKQLRRNPVNLSVKELLESSFCAFRRPLTGRRLPATTTALRMQCAKMRKLSVRQPVLLGCGCDSVREAEGLHLMGLR